MPDWQRAFVDPIPLPGGRKLLTLKDSADFIIALPKREHDLAPWRTAMQALLLSAEHGQAGTDPMMARIANMRALDRDEPKALLKPRRKQAKAYRIVTSSSL